MAVQPESPALIRAALLRKALADTGQRAALARRLGVTDNEVLAVQHLSRAGELTPGQLSTRLQLSSGGTTGLIQRMQRAGHVARDVHPRDARSVVLRLTPEIQTWAADAWAPLVADIDALVHDMSSKEAKVVRAFLEAVANAADRHATRVAADADASARDSLAVPLPALWS
jgi:DNA-binding MarR family transcriptional regulator